MVMNQIEKETIRYQSSTSLSSNIEARSSTAYSTSQAKVLLVSLSLRRSFNYVNYLLDQAAAKGRRKEGT